MLTVMPEHPHFIPTGRDDRYAGLYSPISNRPFSPLYGTLVTLFKLVVLIVMPAPLYSFPNDRAHRYAGSS